jgi:hypothetical protein
VRRAPVLRRHELHQPALQPRAGGTHHLQASVSRKRGRLSSYGASGRANWQGHAHTTQR